MKGSRHEDGRASRQARHAVGQAGNASVRGLALGRRAGKQAVGEAECRRVGSQAGRRGSK
jgi:hypothetical protein